MRLIVDGLIEHCRGVFGEGDSRLRIYTLTSVGNHEASSPMSNPSTARSILYFMRRHGGSVSDDRIKEFVVDGSEMQFAIRKLLQAKAIRIVG